MATEGKFLKLPQDIVECWNDDERMDFLFSAFPATNLSNPTHWNAKMDFWTNLLTAVITSFTGVCVTFNSVLEAVERHGRQPLGLEIVWQALIEQKTLVSSSEYTKDLNMNSTWVGWGLNHLFRKPSLWVTGKMLSPIKSRPHLEISYICVKSLPIKCGEVLGLLRDATTMCTLGNNMHVIQFETFISLTKEAISSFKCLDVILSKLEQEKKIEIFTIQNVSDHPDKLPLSSNDRYIKFCKTVKPVSHVDEVDKGIVHLSCTKVQIQEEVKNIYKKQNVLVNDAKQCLKNGQHVLAKHAIRQKQILSKTLVKKEQCLNKIDHLLENINQSKMDKMTLDSFKAGVHAHNTFKKESGLTLEQVENTLDDVADLIAENEEISSIMAANITDELGDDYTYEKELEDLVKEDNENQIKEMTAALDSLNVNKGERGSPVKSPQKATPKLKPMPTV